MKTTLIANINGVAFLMEEDGYIKLELYLKTLKQKLGNNSEADEVVGDIEARIAELFSRTHNGTAIAINLDEVKEVIEIIGDVDEFGSDEEPSKKENESNNSKVNSESDKNTTAKGSKRLYRDVENRVFGGVCSGLGCYFGIDPVAVRLIMLLLVVFGGLSAWIYIILWIVIPAARSFSQKIEMYGQVDSQGKFANQPQSYYSNTIIAKTITFVLRVMAIFFGVIFSIVAFAVVLAALGFVAIIPQFDMISNSGVIDFVNNNILGGTNFVMGTIGLFLILIVPAILLLYAGVKLVKSRPYKIKFLVPAAIALWLIGLVLIIFTGARIGSQFKAESSVSTSYTLKPTKAKTIYLKNSQLTTINGEDLIFNVYSPSQNQMVGFPRIKIEQGDSLRIEIKRTSRGSSSADAISNAKYTNYKFEQIDSVISLDEHFTTELSAKLRNQKVEVIITLPNSVTVLVDPSIQENVDYINQQISSEPAVAISGLKKGIKYSYYEDEFYELPNFEALSADRTGVIPTINLHFGPREDNFAVEYQGYVYFAENGIYKIYSNSDDGSKVYINDQLVVNNDGLHEPKFEYVTMNLKKGYYPIKVQYFEQAIDEKLEVGYWTDSTQPQPFTKDMLFYKE